MPSTGLLSVVNGYASNHGGQSSPGSGRFYSQTTSPGGGSVDLYSPTVDGNGYIQQATTSPQFTMSVGVKILNLSAVRAPDTFLGLESAAFSCTSINKLVLMTCLNEKNCEVYYGFLSIWLDYVKMVKVD